MINFEALPQENPFALPDPDIYMATIMEADMRNNKTDATKPPYLNIKYNLMKADGTSAGTLYDIISDSDNATVQYKTGRFIRACEIPLQGSMELKDLAKIVKGKRIVVDVAHDTKGDRPRAQIDLFSRGAYYLPAEFNEIYGAVHPDAAPVDESFLNPPVDGDTEFNAPDGNATPGTGEY